MITLRVFLNGKRERFAAKSRDVMRRVSVVTRVTADLDLSDFTLNTAMLAFDLMEEIRIRVLIYIAYIVRNILFIH